MNMPGSPAVNRKTTKLLIVDDHPIFRLGLVQLLGNLDDMTVSGEAADAQQALEAVRTHRPEVVLMDISMPGTNGIELIKLMLAEQPQLLILVVSIHDESLYALRALRAGAKGYVMKQQAMDNVVTALRKVISGGIYISPQFSEKLIFKVIHGSNDEQGLPLETLSDRELEILQLFGRSKTTREIAEELHLSVKTIETHRIHIKKKLGFDDAESLVKFAVEWVAASES